VRKKGISNRKIQHSLTKRQGQEKVVKANMAIKPVNLTLENKNNSQPTSSPVAFKGGFPNPVIATMDAMERGGLAASFMTQDMLGMGAPRVATGLNRNKEETGQYNWKFAKSEALREVLSGPSTFAIPALVLFATGKLVGSANKIPGTLIKDFGDDFAEFVQKQPADVLSNKVALKEGYYKHAMKNILEGSTNSGLKGKKLDSIANSFAKRVIEIENEAKKSFSEKLSDSLNNIQNIFRKKENKVVSKTAKSLTEKLINDFSIIKRKFASSDSSVLSANFKNEKMQTSFENFLKHLQNYTKDVTKSVGKKFKPEATQSIKEFVENFTHKRIGSRFLTTVGMTTAVVSFFTFIPKLYKSKDGKNHALDGLIPQEAKAPQTTTAPQAVKVEGK